MLEVVFAKISRETMIADWKVTTISTLAIYFFIQKVQADYMHPYKVSARHTVPTCNGKDCI